MEVKRDFPQKEFILECPIYQITETRGMIGLPRVAADRVWMVPRAEKGSYVFVNHDIYFL